MYTQAEIKKARTKIINLVENKLNEFSEDLDFSGDLYKIITELYHGYKKSKNVIEELKKEIESLEQDNREFEAKNEEYANHIAYLESEMEDKEAEIEEFKERIRYKY